jgi:hypothetical protein
MSFSSDFESIIQRIDSIFSELNIWYFIGGSVASSNYGMARATLDIDMVTTMTITHVPRLISLLGADFYYSEDQILSAINQRTSFNLIHLQSSIKLDIFISKERPYDIAASNRRRFDSISSSAESKNVVFASPEDVILAKLEWYRAGDCVSDKQWQDILGVLNVQKGFLDLDYLQNWASTFFDLPICF